MDDIFLARHPTPEDYNKAVNMNSGSVETARDRESTRSLTTSASTIDAHKEGSPVVAMSSETPPSAPVMASRTEQTDGDLTGLQSPRPLRAAPHISGSQHMGQLSPLPVSSPRLSTYELEATVVSKTTASNGISKAYQPGSASQRTSVTSQGYRDGRGYGPSNCFRTVPGPLKIGSTTPATAIHHSNTSKANTPRRTSEGSESDPFLGTGRPMVSFPSSPGPMTSGTTIETPSPSIARLRSSQLEGTSGLLDLHDTQGEILLLLKKLENAHRTHTNNEVEAALERCQVDLRARSKDKAIGTAEGNILDREAARIGRVGGTPTKPSRETEDAALLRSLRRELIKLVEDARAAIDAADQAKSQAASSSGSQETKGYIPYRVGEDSPLAALNSENLELRSEIRELKNQVDRLQAEKELACKEGELARKEKSDLFSKVDRLTEEVKGYRRETPWRKDWNTGSSRIG